MRAPLKNAESNAAEARVDKAPPATNKAAPLDPADSREDSLPDA